tara:strand:+ start:191 stop:640 length:450 start_codon:yes stop_codon:yes gene_type:complete
MTLIKVAVNIIGEASVVEDYWQNLSHISSNSSDSEILFSIEDITFNVAKKNCQDSDITIRIMPNDNTEGVIVKPDQYNVQWVELVREVRMADESNLHVVVKADAPEGITSIVWSEDTWIPILDYLEKRELINTVGIDKFHSITEGMYWG